MITIQILNTPFEGEPGPNFIWVGQPDEFCRLVFDLHKLGTNDSIIIDIDNYSYVNVLGGKYVLLKSNKNSNTLCKILDDIIIVELDSKLWREVLHKFLSVSFIESHNYVEFDDYEIHEEANFIISSGG